MCKRLREQFNRQCARALDVSTAYYVRDPVVVAMVKWPGMRAGIGIYGASVSFDVVERMRAQGVRIRYLRVYRRGQEVPRPYRTGLIP